MLEKNINEALVNSQPSVKALINIIEEIDRKQDLGNTALYHQFPLYPVEDGNKSVAADILFLSQKYGSIIFQCIEFSERIESDLKVHATNLDEIDRIIFAKI